MKNYKFIENNSQAQEAVEHLMTFDRLALDTEGTGLQVIGGVAKLLLIQLGTPDFAYLFDARKIDCQILRPVLESDSILKILHNAKYDYQIIRVQTGMVLRNVFDTMLAYRILTSGKVEDNNGGFVFTGFRDKGKKTFPYKSLKFLVKKYLGLVLDKDVRSTFINHGYKEPFTQVQLDYAADDVFVLHPLCDMLADELATMGLIDTALLEFQFVEPCSEMELNGVELDVAQWRKIIHEAQRKAHGFKQQIDAMVADYSEQNTLFGRVMVDINSPAQLLQIFEKRGHSIENTESKALKQLNDPLAKLVLSYREYMKLISTYGEAILRKINRHTGRLHFTLQQLGADTGRLSSEKPNIQNIPNDKEDDTADVQISFRDCFIAAEGNMMLTADFSQCELRILAEESQDPTFLEIFRNDLDLHIITSQQVFGYSDSALANYKKVKKKDEPGVNLLDFFTAEEVADYKKVHDARSKTKTINFGIVYGLSAWSLSEQFKMPKSEAEQLLEDYFKNYHGIKRWLDKNSKRTLENRYAETILGRKKFFCLPNPHDDEEMWRRAKGATRRQGNNHVIQGTNADITKRSLVDLNEAYKKYVPEAKILFTVHDEIVSECPEHLAQKAAEIKAQVMRDAFHVFIKSVPVGAGDKVGVSIAKVWSK